MKLFLGFLLLSIFLVSCAQKNECLDSCSCRLLVNFNSTVDRPKCEFKFDYFSSPKVFPQGFNITTCSSFTKEFVAKVSFCDLDAYMDSNSDIMSCSCSIIKKA